MCPAPARSSSRFGPRSAAKTRWSARAACLRPARHGSGARARGSELPRDGTASSARKRACCSASAKASVIFLWLAKNGARSRATVVRSEKAAIATTAAIRRVVCRRLQRDRTAERDADRGDRGRPEGVDHPAEIPLLVVAVGAGVASRLAVRSGPRARAGTDPTGRVASLHLRSLLRDGGTRVQAPGGAALLGVPRRRPARDRERSSAGAARSRAMIATSATLKMPVRTGPMPTFRKSTTLPLATRSKRFETPPAQSSATPAKAATARAVADAARQDSQEQQTRAEHEEARARAFRQIRAETEEARRGSRRTAGARCRPGSGARADPPGARGRGASSHDRSRSSRGRSRARPAGRLSLASGATTSILTRPGRGR